MHEYVVAALAVALVVFAWWYSHRAEAAVSSKYVSTASSSLWANDPNAAYVCDNTLMGGWCVLPDATTGATVCSADAKCAGYLVPGPDTLAYNAALGTLAASSPGIVQLYSAPLVGCASCTDTTVMAKSS